MLRHFFNFFHGEDTWVFLWIFIWCAFLVFLLPDILLRFMKNKQLWRYNLIIWAAKFVFVQHLFLETVLYKTVINNVRISNLFWDMGYARLQNYQSMLRFQHPHADLFNEIVLIHTHRYLLYMSHILLLIYYILNKHH